MAKYEVRQGLSIECTAVVIVEAESKEDAVDKASDLFPGSAYDAIHEANKGWKASVVLKPPAAHLDALKRNDIKGQYIQCTSGPGPLQAKKLKE